MSLKAHSGYRAIGGLNGDGEDEPKGGRGWRQVGWGWAMLGSCLLVPVCKAGPHFTEEMEVQRGQEALPVPGAWNRVGTKAQSLTSRS